MAHRMIEAGGVMVQAESEVAAINMAMARPPPVQGHDIQFESGYQPQAGSFSYIAGAELPAVVVNIVRSGPARRNSAALGDYFQATKGGGHGDYRNIVLAPASIQELYELTVDAFNLAERYRMLTMIFGDGTLGQMMEPVLFREEEPINRPDRPWAVTGTQGLREHNTVQSIYIEADDLEQVNLRLQAKYHEVAAQETRFETVGCDDAEIIVVAFGSCSRISRNVIRRQPMKASRWAWYGDHPLAVP
jgi:2-oxoglutarate ferredoxin oxidoreductase subunit alpha